MADPQLANACEIIRNRLYFASFHQQPRRNAGCHFFSTDNELVYEPFFDDFGPLNLAMLYRFVCHLAHKLQDRALSEKKIVYYSGVDPKKRAVAACLIGTFAVIHLHQSPEDAMRPLMCADPPFKAFKDVYGGTWNCTLLDCFRATATAIKLGWFRFKEFNVQEYEYYERVENGDLNQIVPGKFVAFSGPSGSRTDSSLGPEDYIPILKRFGVTAVVRLNKKVYERKLFLDAGIKHYDLYFVDGGNPSEAILTQWMHICENEPGAIGVHCKAGLGRTGVLNACYLMKHYRVTANELIAWFRTCRPGSVIGPQQQYIKEMEKRMWAEGELYRRRHQHPPIGSPELQVPPAGWYDEDPPADSQEEDLIRDLVSLGVTVRPTPAADTDQHAGPVRGMYVQATGGSVVSESTKPAAASVPMGTLASTAAISNASRYC